LLPLSSDIDSFSSDGLLAFDRAKRAPRSSAFRVIPVFPVLVNERPSMK